MTARGLVEVIGAGVPRTPEGVRITAPHSTPFVPGAPAPVPAVRLYVGGHAGKVQGEREDLTGNRCFTAAHPPQVRAPGAGRAITGILDSGAFSDPPARRLSCAGALDRQLTWEARAGRKWGDPWRAAVLVSYDRLIDETWVGDLRIKRRWTIAAAERAVAETVEAAAYLASQRAALAPRTLMLSCQGVDAEQYAACVRAVLAYAQPGDWIGLGGWCILGLYKSWLPTFWATLRACLPLIAAAGVRHVHLLGVLYRPALGGLVWLADRAGISVSADSKAPIMACTWKGEDKRQKSGARFPYWRDNVRWWVDELAYLRSDARFYCEPPAPHMARQMEMAL